MKIGLRKSKGVKAIFSGQAAEDNTAFKLSPLKGNYKLIIKKGKYHAKP